MQIQRVVLRQTSEMVDYLLLLTALVHCSWYYASGAVVPYTVPFSLKLGNEMWIHTRYQASIKLVQPQSS